MPRQCLSQYYRAFAISFFAFSLAGCKQVGMGAAYIIVGVFMLGMVFFFLMGLGGISKNNKEGKSNWGVWVNVIILALILIGSFKQCMG
jgi:hypothetical protein